MSCALLLFVSYLLPSAPPVVPSSDVVAADTLVVCAPGLRESIQPWVDYRTAQGYRIKVVTNGETAEAIRAEVRSVAAGGRLRFVLLVGDVTASLDARDFHVATHMADAKINTRWGSEPQIASDNWFADLDDDDAPDLAIGRIPADSPAELRTIIGKIIAYEQSSPRGAWRRRVNLVAGVGGFGMLADAVLETATGAFIRRGIPEGYRTSMTYASWRSPYCPDPRAFREHVIARMNEGCLCWVYIGHGQRRSLDWIRVPIGVAPILTVEDVDRVVCRQGAPIALFLSCYGACFDGTEEGLGEQLLACSEGPVAVIGGSRVTMPYGMAVLSQHLMQGMFRDHAATLGEMLLMAKRQTLEAPEPGAQARWLDALATALSPNPDDLSGERREHVQMFHLLGDPLTRLHHAHPVEIESPTSVGPGDELTLKCRSAVAGTCTIELACRRGRLSFQPTPRVQFDGSHQGMMELTRVYRQANEDRFTSQQLVSTAGQFTTTLKIPDDLEGPCAIRVFVEGPAECALGAATLYVSRRESRDDASLAVPPSDASSQPPRSP